MVLVVFIMIHGLLDNLQIITLFTHLTIALNVIVILLIGCGDVLLEYPALILVHRPMPTLALIECSFSK